MEYWSIVSAQHSITPILHQSQVNQSRKNFYV
jgi:hypothetical protein